ncbi:MAG: hypothetical protein ACRENX_08150, partial [Candidatus Dormibacteria bacterium]
MLSFSLVWHRLGRLRLPLLATALTPLLAQSVSAAGTPAGQLLLGDASTGSVTAVDLGSGSSTSVPVP